jgi:hypothetical protein
MSNGPKWAMLRREARVVAEEQGYTQAQAAAMADVLPQPWCAGRVGPATYVRALRGMGVGDDVVAEVMAADVRDWLAGLDAEEGA